MAIGAGWKTLICAGLSNQHNEGGTDLSTQSCWFKTGTFEVYGLPKKKKSLLGSIRAERRFKEKTNVVADASPHARTLHHCRSPLRLHVQEKKRAREDKACVGKRKREKRARTRERERESRYYGREKRRDERICGRVDKRLTVSAWLGIGVGF